MSTASTHLPDDRSASDDQCPVRLHSLSILTQRGYGSRAALAERIKRGEIPAVRVGNRFKVRDSDLHCIAVPVTGDAA